MNGDLYTPVKEPLGQKDRANALRFIEAAAAGRGRRSVALVVAYLRQVNRGLTQVIQAQASEIERLKAERDGALALQGLTPRESS